jgi:hypothetical protein
MVISISFHYMICVNNMNSAQKLKLPMRLFIWNFIIWTDRICITTFNWHRFFKSASNSNEGKKLPFFNRVYVFVFIFYNITSQMKIKFLVYQSHKCHKIDSSHFFTPPHERRKKKENQRIENCEYCNKEIFCL